MPSSSNRELVGSFSRRRAVDDAIENKFAAPERCAPKFHSVWSAIDRGDAVISKENSNASICENYRAGRRLERGNCRCGGGAKLHWRRDLEWLFKPGRRNVERFDVVS